LKKVEVYLIKAVTIKWRDWIGWKGKCAFFEPLAKVRASATLMAKRRRQMQFEDLSFTRAGSRVQCPSFFSRLPGFRAWLFLQIFAGKLCRSIGACMYNVVQMRKCQGFVLCFVV